MRTIFHLDLDAFFISVERLLDPSLEGKPVVVGSDPTGRGVVSACSYEARRFGLHSAMPIRQAYRLCPHGVYLPGHFKEYVHYSKAVRELLEKYAPMLEQASIDEFYMDFSGCRKIYGHPYEFAAFLQKEIKAKLGLPCSIGIAGNKTVAKICSDFMKPKGITYVIPGMEKDFLSRLPVETMPGVGKVTLKELNYKGFYTIGDVARAPMEYFSTAFGKPGLDIWEKANGKGTEFLTITHERKSISKEHTYDKDVTSRKIVEQTLFELTEKVSQYLRDRQWLTSTITLKLRYSDFVTLNRSRTILPTDDDQVIFNTACTLLNMVYNRRIAVRLIGVHLSKFTGFAEQEVLFESETLKRKKMLRVVTDLRKKYGFDTIHLGTAGS